MDLAGLEKLIAAVGVALAAILSPIGVIYAASINRKNKSSETTIESLTEDVERLEQELKDTTEECEKQKKSGLRWYDLAFFWYAKANELRGNVQEARQVAESAVRRYNVRNPEDEAMRLPDWSTSLLLPRMEDPIPESLPLTEKK